ncbi:MAG: PhzF family phenazine biosynthesis protein [Gemmatimonadota bacterium]|nr:PhzF family phenazine biosynthesis protein [Gemmatimonadota bacterium]
MERYEFFQLDVFTDKPLSGNPLAVFHDGRGLDDSVMQALAREMNLSETVFVTKSDKADRRVRFFTPTSEIPLAGHPTVGTWWLLAEREMLDLPKGQVSRVTQETGAGVLPVDIHMGENGPIEVFMTQTLPNFGKKLADREALCRALGGSEDLIPSDLPLQVVATALPQLMVPTTSLGALEGLPTGGRGGELSDLLASLGTHCAMCYSLETVAADATVHCRMFAPGLGVPEDPATGSAAGALGCYLVRYGITPPHDGKVQIIVEQGIEIGRPSRIKVEVSVDDDGEISEVRVGGTAVTVIQGEVTL